MSFSKPQVCLSSNFAHCSVLWKITPLDVFRSNVIYFAQKEPIKVEISRVSSVRSKFTEFLSILKELISFSSNFASIFSVMRHKSSILFWLKFYVLSTKGAYQSINLVKFHVSSRKSATLHFDGFLWSKSFKVYAKEVQKSYPHDTEEWCKVQIKTNLWFQIWHEELDELLIRALKSLKTCTLMGSFCPKHIIFQPENFIGVMYHNTEGWCKI